jgi:hypothetical protein
MAPKNAVAKSAPKTLGRSATKAAKSAKAGKLSAKEQLAASLKSWAAPEASPQPKVAKKPAARVPKKRPASKDVAEAEEVEPGDGLEELEEVEEEPQSETAENRDRLKAIQFAKHLHSFPEWVQKAWAGSTSRAEKTKLVNSLVARDPATGKYHFDLDNPSIQALVDHVVFLPCLIMFVAARRRRRTSSRRSLARAPRHRKQNVLYTTT